MRTRHLVFRRESDEKNPTPAWNAWRLKNESTGNLFLLETQKDFKMFLFTTYPPFFFFFCNDLNFNQSEKYFFWFTCESIMRECQNLNFKTVQCFHFIWAKLPQGQKKRKKNKSSVSLCLSILGAFMYIWGEGVHCILKYRRKARFAWFHQIIAASFILSGLR